MVQPWKGCVGASPPGVRIPPPPPMKSEWYVNKTAVAVEKEGGYSQVPTEDEGGTMLEHLAFVTIY